jgi:hypothetical protein
MTHKFRTHVLVIAATGKMFFLGRYNDPATLGDIANAIVYYGNIKDAKVDPVKQ